MERCLKIRLFLQEQLWLAFMQQRNGESGTFITILVALRIVLHGRKSRDILPETACAIAMSEKGSSDLQNLLVSQHEGAMCCSRQSTLLREPSFALIPGGYRNFGEGASQRNEA
jgi:hypothetical protein